MRPGRRLGQWTPKKIRRVIRDYQRGVALAVSGHPAPEPADRRIRLQQLHNSCRISESGQNWPNTGRFAKIAGVVRNGGGFAASVAYLMSHFFPRGDVRHLNDMYYRPENATTQFWTMRSVALRYDKPVYVLTSARTGSAGEECAYDFQTQKRATLVGDLLTPVAAFLKLRNGRKGSAFLLESVEGGATRGRFSMIGLDPDLGPEMAG